MIAIISPAKTLDFETAWDIKDYSIPRFRSEAKKLINELKKLKKEELEKLMDISDQLATLNMRRYKQFKLSHTPENSKPSILAFKGDVYVGFEAWNMTHDQLVNTNDHVRILSGLYGILNPLDLVQPYRLEMGTQLHTDYGNNLYQFWGNKVTKALNKDLKDVGTSTIINLASNEYYHVLNPKKIKAKVVDIDFKENRNGKLIFVSFNAKKARGKMARFIVENELRDVHDLLAFDGDGYLYDANLSTEDKFVFVK
ncbi:MAG: peroxide stress protein YaaA [Saprospiraceae bacterium]|nr:peroxide stress protein YaaA [Saprospiraceae bacterium]MCB9327523.1 peroxide stress protein YaaA [Lewinellaceae bacterium]